MTSDDRLRRILYGIHRQFQDIPARSARAKATIRRTRPWEAGTIGQVEDMVHRYLVFADQRELTTGELARLIYANPPLGPRPAAGQGRAAAQDQELAIRKN